jgi:hypothetical protein
MKCVKRGDEVVRVSDDKVKDMANKGYTLCSKSEWRKTGRKR